jgi:hypothetical protein
MKLAPNLRGTKITIFDDLNNKEQQNWRKIVVRNPIKHLILSHYCTSCLNQSF